MAPAPFVAAAVNSGLGKLADSGTAALNNTSSGDSADVTTSGGQAPNAGPRVRATGDPGGAESAGGIGAGQLPQLSLEAAGK